MIYLDNASTTRIDDDVLNIMIPFMNNLYGNAGALYELGRDSKTAIETARRQVSDLINANPEQIIFTSGGSEANNLVFNGLIDFFISNKKRTIITSQIEHDSIMNILKKSYIKQHFDIHFIEPSPWGDITIDYDTRQLISSGRVGLVSVMCVNNETGIVNDVRKIGRICRESGVLFHTDCVQAIGDINIDVDKIDCDFLSMSSHKIHGSKGVGALYARDKSLLTPIISGGNEQEFGFRGGTENVAGIAGFGKACEILKRDREKNMRYIGNLRRTFYCVLVHNLKQKGLGGLVHINGGVDLYDNGKILNLRFDGVDAETLVILLDSYGVCVSAGSACRSHESEPSYVLRAMGFTSDDARNSIRISFSKMNTIDEIKQAAEIIANCVDMLCH